MLSSVSQNPKYESFRADYRGTKRPGVVPGARNVEPRLALDTPTSDVPGLGRRKIPSTTQKPTRATNVPIVYSRLMYKRDASLESKQSTHNGDLMFVSKSDTLFGTMTNRMSRVATWREVNELLDREENWICPDVDDDDQIKAIMEARFEMWQAARKVENDATEEIQSRRNAGQKVTEEQELYLVELERRARCARNVFFELLDLVSRGDDIHIYPEDDWISVPALRNWTPDGVLLNTDGSNDVLNEMFPASTDSETLYNIVVHGPARMRNAAHGLEAQYIKEKCDPGDVVFMCIVAEPLADGCFKFTLKPTTLSRLHSLANMELAEARDFDIDDLLMTAAAWKVATVMDTQQVRTPIHGVGVAVQIELYTRDQIWGVLGESSPLGLQKKLQAAYDMRVQELVLKQMTKEEEAYARVLALKAEAAARAAAAAARLLEEQERKRKLLEEEERLRKEEEARKKREEELSRVAGAFEKGARLIVQRAREARERASVMRKQLKSLQEQQAQYEQEQASLIKRLAELRGDILIRRAAIVRQRELQRKEAITGAEKNASLEIAQRQLEAAPLSEKEKKQILRFAVRRANREFYADNQDYLNVLSNLDQALANAGNFMSEEETAALRKAEQRRGLIRNLQFRLGVYMGEEELREALNAPPTVDEFNEFYEERIREYLEEEELAMQERRKRINKLFQNVKMAGLLATALANQRRSFEEARLAKQQRERRVAEALFYQIYRAWALSNKLIKEMGRPAQNRQPSILEQQAPPHLQPLPNLQPRLTMPVASVKSIVVSPFDVTPQMELAHAFDANVENAIRGGFMFPVKRRPYTVEARAGPAFSMQRMKNFDCFISQDGVFVAALCRTRNIVASQPSETHYMAYQNLVKYQELGIISAIDAMLQSGETPKMETYEDICGILYAFEEARVGYELCTKLSQAIDPKTGKKAFIRSVKLDKPTMRGMVHFAVADASESDTELVVGGDIDWKYIVSLASGSSEQERAKVVSDWLSVFFDTPFTYDWVVRSTYCERTLVDKADFERNSNIRLEMTGRIAEAGLRLAFHLSIFAALLELLCFRTINVDVLPGSALLGMGTESSMLESYVGHKLLTAPFGGSSATDLPHIQEDAFLGDGEGLSKELVMLPFVKSPDLIGEPGGIQLTFQQTPQPSDTEPWIAQNPIFPMSSILFRFQQALVVPPSPSRGFLFENDQASYIALRLPETENEIDLPPAPALSNFSKDQQRHVHRSIRAAAAGRTMGAGYYAFGALTTLKGAFVSGTSLIGGLSADYLVYSTLN